MFSALSVGVAFIVLVFGIVTKERLQKTIDSCDVNNNVGGCSRICGR